jgi:hypothetical protein
MGMAQSAIGWLLAMLMFVVLGTITQQQWKRLLVSDSRFGGRRSHDGLDQHAA